MGLISYLLLDLAALGLNPCILQKNFSEKNVDVAEVNQWHCLEESRQWLENADPTHLVMACATKKIMTV